MRKFAQSFLHFSPGADCGHVYTSRTADLAFQGYGDPYSTETTDQVLLLVCSKHNHSECAGMTFCYPCHGSDIISAETCAHHQSPWSERDGYQNIDILGAYAGSAT